MLRLSCCAGVGRDSVGLAGVEEDAPGAGEGAEGSLRFRAEGLSTLAAGGMDMRGSGWPWGLAGWPWERKCWSCWSCAGLRPACMELGTPC